MISDLLKLYWTVLLLLTVAAWIFPAPLEGQDALPVNKSGMNYKITYSKPINVSNTPESISQDSAFAIDVDGAINVAWQEMGTADLRYSRSLDDGKTFSEPITLFYWGSDYSVAQTSMATSTNRTVHIAFTIFDKFYGAAEIGYVQSTDGIHFSDLVLVSKIDNFNSYDSSIAVDSSNITIAWSDSDSDTGITPILLSQSVDDGLEFSEPRILSDNHSYCPNVSIWDSQNIYIAWNQGFYPNVEIFFSKSNDAGLTFSSPINISNIPEKSWCPQIAVDETGIIYVVWEEGSVFDRKTLIMSSIDGGDSFSSPKLLSVNVEDVRWSALAVDANGRVYVTFSTGSFIDHTAETFLRISSNKGISFSNTSKIPVLSGAGFCPEIIAGKENQLHLVWTDGWSDDPSSRERDIFYSRGTVLGPYELFPWEIFIPAITHGTMSK